MTTSIVPTVSSPGVGSGLDVNSIVTQLVAAERSVKDQLLATKTTKVNAQISALGTFKSAFSTLQTSIKSLSSGGALSQMSASSADAGLFGASASTAATAGVYNVEVVSLALASKSASNAYASADSVVGDGAVTIGVGAASFSVTLTPGADSLSALASAINQAADNKGVSATIINDVAGAHLLLTAQKTGTSTVLSISSALTSDSSPFLTMSSVQTAANAHIRVDTFDSYSDSNTVTSAVSGLTINLLKAAPGTTTALTVAVNQQAASTAVQSFVNAYNAVVATVANLTRYDSTGKNTGALIGDSSVSGVNSQLRSIIGSEITGTGSQWTLLSQLGITTNTDGSLKLDNAKLGTAMTQDLGSVQKLLSGTGGLSAKLTTVMDRYLQTGGQIDARTTGLQSQLKDVTKQTDLLNERMQALQARYLAQFSALDTLISKMKQTSSYLTQQLANLPGFTTNSKS